MVLERKKPTVLVWNDMIFYIPSIRCTRRNGMLRLRFVRILKEVAGLFSLNIQKKILPKVR